MSARKSAGMALACVFVGGCASVDVQRVKYEDQHGIRYWRPAPYVAVGAVITNGNMSCQASIVELPDKEEEYAITINTGLWGAASANPTLQDGWNLTGLNASADSKTAEVLTALASVMTAVPKLGPLVARNGAPPACPGGLYRLAFDEFGRISGLRLVPGSAGLGFPPPPASPPKPAPGGDVTPVKPKK